MRKCKYRENCSSLIWEDGYFHGFFNITQTIADRSISNPWVIIEFKNGMCQVFPIDCVKFNEPPKKCE